MPVAQWERGGARRRRGVIDRAEQAGDVAGGGVLAPALLERAQGLAFEVDDHPVAGPRAIERLAQVEIAVVADFLPSHQVGEGRADGVVIDGDPLVRRQHGAC